MVTAYLLAHSGANNPSRELSAEQEADFKTRFEKLIALGPRTDLLLGGRGGVGLRWVTKEHAHYLVCRGGVVALFDESGSSKLFSDTPDIHGLLRACLTEERDQLDKPAELLPNFAR